MSESSETNFVESLWFKFFPFWPLFALLSIVFLAPAFVYALFQQPTYSVFATLVINEEENLVNQNQPFGTLNAYAKRQIVDNEVLVLHSRALMKNVVNSLFLYAPIVEKEPMSVASAYITSPIVIEARESDDLIATEELIHFEFDNESETIIIENKNYPFNKWINFSFGTVRFLRNPRAIAPNEKPLFFSIVNPTKVADALLNSLEAGPVSKLSTAISISFQTDIPEKGEDIVNQLLREYLAASVASEARLAASTLKFVDDRLSNVEADLDSTERKIQQFSTTEGVVDLSEQGRIYLQNVAENDRKVADINSQLAVLDQVQQYLNSEGQRSGIIPTTLGIEDPVLAQLIQTLNELEIELARLKTTTAENNPLVVTVQNEIQKIRPNIRNIVGNQRARLTASRNNLSNTSEGFNSMIRDIPELERELLEISREQAVKKELYSFLLQRKEEAALSNASTIADHEVIDWAEASVATVSSNRFIILIGSIVAAFALGLAFIFFKENLNSKILFRSEVESITAIPVIAEVIYKKRSSPLVFQNKAGLAVIEQFRRLQTALGLLNSQAGSQKVLVTSSLSNEGKSFISSNLAASIALSGKRVALVDSNLRNPEVSSVFQLSSEKGLADFLQGKADLQEVITATQVSNLDVIPAGARVGNPMELLLSKNMNDLFSQLEQYYDYIIIDTPPVELATDAHALSRFCDISLYVVRFGVTPGSVLKSLDEDLNLKQMQNLGIVLNGIKGRGFVSKYFGYGYGYGKEKVYKDRFYSQAE